MTHVEVSEELLPMTGEVMDLLDAYTGYVKAFDFSRANSSYEARVAAVTKVASICYGNPKALGSISLFNRLEAESHGLPSSSYEFVPVLLNEAQISVIYAKVGIDSTDPIPQVEKFGEQLGTYLLTNLRALIADVGPEESLNYLNTSDEEIQIIRDNFKVFLFNVDLSTRAQMVRHRVSWQELSRRYVSGKKQPFEFYKSAKLDTVEVYHPSTWVETPSDMPNCPAIVYFDLERLIDLCTNFYDAAIEAGIKPEEARRILPQAMMTQIWGAFQPSQLDNWFKLRLDKHAQHEIQQVAQAMKDLL